MNIIKSIFIQIKRLFIKSRNLIIAVKKKVSSKINEKTDTYNAEIEFGFNLYFVFAKIKITKK